MKALIIIFVSLFGINTVLHGQNKFSIASSEITFVYVSSKVDGSVKGFSSSSSIDLDNLDTSSFKGSVKTETLKTGNFLRDWSIRGEKYFDAETYPTLNFESTSIRKEGTILIVNGNLTIKETTKAITIRFKQEGKKLTGTTSLYSSDYGISVKKKREKNKVNVTIVLNLK